MRSSISALAVPSVVAMSLTLAPSASAHDQLISTTPTTGSTLSKTPNTLSLTFNRAPMEIGSEVVVKAPDGKPKSLAPKTSGTTVSVPFTPSAGNGKYQVVWRVVSGDGHPISGTFDFTLKGASSAPAAPSASSSSGGTSSQPGTSSATPTESKDAESSSTAWVSGGVAAGVIALLVGGALWLKGRRSGKTDEADVEAPAGDE